MIKFQMQGNKLNFKIPSNAQKILDDCIQNNPNLAASQEIILAMTTEIYNIGFVDALNKEIVDKLTSIETKMDKLQSVQNSSARPSYAQILNSPRTCTESTKYPQPVLKPRKEQVILLYPKSSRDLNESTNPVKTLNIDEIKSLINDNLKNIGIIRLHKIKKGGILIEVRDKKDLSSINDLIFSHLSSSVITRLPQLRNPELRIKNISKSFTEKEIIPRLIEQNNIPDHLKDKLLSCKISTTRFGRKDAIVTVKNPLFNSLLKNGKIFLDFSRLDVIENIFVRTCSTCFNSGHTKLLCPLTEKVICRKCGSDHKAEDCKDSSFYCWRCPTYSHVKTIQHKFGSDNCVIFQNEAKRLFTITDYDDDE